MAEDGPTWEELARWWEARWRDRHALVQDTLRQNAALLAENRLLTGELARLRTPRSRRARAQPG